MSPCGSSSPRRLAACRLAACRRGAAAIETGFCAVALVLLLAGGVDAARWHFATQSLRSLTAEAMRLALADDAILGCDAPLAALRARAPGIVRSFVVPGVTLCVTRGTQGGLSRVTVQTSRPFSATVPGLRHLPSSLGDTVTVTY